MKIKQIPTMYRILDYLLTPVMYILGGCKMDSIQKTHGYHAKNINVILDNCKTIEITGDDTSRFKNSRGFINNRGYFHMPIFGGWKSYVILENTEFSNAWFVGWKTPSFYQVSRLKISTPLVKLLKGRKGDKSIFFGFDLNGNQIKLKKVADGTLGDNKFSNVPLY